MNTIIIEKLSWGSIKTSDGQTFKDIKIFPGGCRSWDWNESGTSHSRGIQIADVTELIENGAVQIVLSTGYMKRLKVKKETLEYLKERNIEVFVFATPKAVEKYNEICQSGKTGALIHSTC